MKEYLFETPPTPGLPVRGTAALYPVARIFCVARNYAARAAEMGFKADHEEPFYFTKTPSAAVLASGATIPYPARNRELPLEGGIDGIGTIELIVGAPE